MDQAVNVDFLKALRTYFLIQDVAYGVDPAEMGLVRPIEEDIALEQKKTAMKQYIRQRWTMLDTYLKTVQKQLGEMKLELLRDDLSDQEKFEIWKSYLNLEAELKGLFGEEALADG